MVDVDEQLLRPSELLVNIEFDEDILLILVGLPIGYLVGEIIARLVTTY